MLKDVGAKGIGLVAKVIGQNEPVSSTEANTPQLSRLIRMRFSFPPFSSRRSLTSTVAFICVGFRLCLTILPLLRYEMYEGTRYVC